MLVSFPFQQKAHFIPISMSSQVDEKKPDLKELAKILSDAYYSLLQHHNANEQKVNDSVGERKGVLF